MGTHERKDVPARHASRKPSLLSALVIAAVIVGVVAGVMGLTSLITHDSSSSRVGVSESAPPYPMTFDSPSPAVTSTEYVAAPQNAPETTTARSTVTARVTDVRTSAAPTATVTSTPAPAPTVTQCWVWDDRQTAYEQQDCPDNLKSETP